MKKFGIALLLLSEMLAALPGLHAQTVNVGRTEIPFNDSWLFRKGSLDKDSVDLLPAGYWKAVTVPHTWNAVDMQTGKNFYAGDAWYKKDFFINKALRGKRVFIRFNGVGQVADVYVNHQFIGEHKGGYAAFCFEITYALHYGASNSIEVKVNNAPRKDVVPVNNFLFAIYGGIYRPVSLIVTNKLNITTTDYASPGVYIRQKNVSRAKAEIAVTAKVENTWHTNRQIQMQYALYDEQGRLVKKIVQPVTVLSQGMQSFTGHFTVVRPHLWQGRKDPYLYKVVTSIVDSNKTTDAVAQPLGIRSFQILPGKGFYLNGQPYRLYGVCRHQDRWGYGNALSFAQQDTDMMLIKEIGATSIRFGHYQQSQHIYNDCDSIGFLVWTEIPFVNAVTGEEADNAKQQMTELVRQNFNHPSIYVWGTSNEVYGKNPEDYTPRLIRQLADLAKTEDPDRYTGSTNGYGNIDRPENFNTDIQGINRYFGWYEGRMGDLEGWLDALEKNHPNAKVILAEYGAEANVDQQEETVPDKPPVYDGQYFPEAYQTRLHEVQWGIIQKHPYLVSSYVWNMFDFATPLWIRGGVPGRNMKGLVTFDRKTKKDAFYWYKANWSSEPVIHICGRRANKRHHAATTITVFSNLHNIELYVNGEKRTDYRQGTTSAACIFENISLQTGENKIEAVGKRDNKTFRDTMTWTLE